MAKKEYIRPSYPVDDLLSCACSAGKEKLQCEPDPCHYDTWDVLCLHCGARTSQFARRDMAASVWNAMAEAVDRVRKAENDKLY